MGRPSGGARFAAPGREKSRKSAYDRDPTDQRGRTVYPYICSHYIAIVYVLVFAIIGIEGISTQKGAQRVARKLTDRQRQVLEYLVSEVRNKGYAPSVREIGLALGLRSPSTVHQHLTALEEKGCIRRHGDRMRALEVVDKSLVQNGDGVVLPLVGRVSAGQPILADEQVEEYVAVPPRFFGNVSGCFLLRVRGNSMIGAGILPGDLVIVRRQAHAAPGDIVVALLNEEATVKRLAAVDGRPVLLPENPAYQPILGEFQVVGRVLGTFRTYEEVRGWA